MYHLVFEAGGEIGLSLARSALARISPPASNATLVHIYRNPYVVSESTRRALRTVLRELALQRHEHVSVDEVVLELHPQIMTACSWR